MLLRISVGRERQWVEYYGNMCHKNTMVGEIGVKSGFK
jgi:hypothetical protein